MNLRLLTLGAASLALCSIIMFAPHNASFMDRGMDVIASNRDAVSRESELRLLFGSEFVRLPVNEIYGDVHLEFTPKHSNIFEVEGALLAFHTAFVVHDHEVGRLDEVFHQHIKLHKQDYEAVNSPQSIASSLASPGFLASSGWQKIDGLVRFENGVVCVELMALCHPIPIAKTDVEWMLAKIEEQRVSL